LINSSLHPWAGTPSASASPGMPRFGGDIPCRVCMRRCKRAQKQETMLGGGAGEAGAWGLTKLTSPTSTTLHV